MRVLLLTSEEWNDRTYGNNNMTNWFSGFEDLEIAHVYCSASTPENRCCLKYFRFGDFEIMKSALPFSEKAEGKALIYDDFPKSEAVRVKSEKSKLPTFLRTETSRFLRDFAWKLARIDTDKLKNFLNDFSPDIVFTQRKASLRILRIEKEIHKILPDTPFMVYTADDEYSLKQLYFSPNFWLHRLFVRSALRKNVKFYDLYYTDAEVQAKEYEKLFSVDTAFLAKCGDFSKTVAHAKQNNPLIIVYAGKLYCRRWHTLEKIAKALNEVNKDSVRAVLHIYTQSEIKPRYKRWLDDKKNSYILGRVSPEELTAIYDRADIALHIESFDLKNRLLTRYSFSTKIMDCMNTGCAVMAVCHHTQNGLQYLKKEDAAITVDNTNDLYGVLNRLCDNPSLVGEYAKKAIDCGKRNHQKEHVQKILLDDMKKLVQNKKRNSK